METILPVSRQKYNDLNDLYLKAQEQLSALADTKAIADQNATLLQNIQDITSEKLQQEQTLSQTDANLNQALSQIETLNLENQQAVDTIQKNTQTIDDLQAQITAFQQKETEFNNLISQLNEMSPSIQDAPIENKAQTVKDLFMEHTTGRPVSFPITGSKETTNHGGADMDTLMDIPHMKEA
jgi:chromosome segregation ATPase